MAFRPWTRLILLALLGLAACGGGGSSGSSGGDGGAGGDSGATGPTLSIDDVTTKEGDEGTKELEFTVTLSEKSSDVVKVAYKTQDGTAHVGGTTDQGGKDYEATSATLRFAPGETVQTLTVTINGDHVNEANETFKVLLSKPVGATLADEEGVGTIQNDDRPPPLLTIANGKDNEGNAGLKNATLTVTLSDPSSVPVTVDYSSADATAIEGEDYVAVNGSLTFAPGETTQLVPVPIRGDTSQEPDETLIIHLSNAQNATIAMADAALTIVNDDDSGPSLSIDDVAVAEGSSGAKALSFTISLSKPSTDIVTVDYATHDDTATAGGLSATGGVDYTSASDSVTFAPGETSKQIDILINGDTLNEANESFVVELFNGVNATILDPQGIGGIDNDDALPSVSVGDVVVMEGAALTRTATFIVSMSSSSGRNVSVSFSTENGSASAGSDYVATSGTLVLDAGQTSGYVSVTVNGDLLNEANETFFVDLLSATNASVNDSQGQGTISNDDPLPQISIGDVMITEGNLGSTNAVFYVSLSTASGQSVSVDWLSSDGSALAGQDYIASSGTLTFAPGVTSKTISVAVKGDATDEPNETFNLDLSNASQALISDGHAIGTIIADDSSVPALNIADASVTEGNSLTSTLTFTVTLDAASAQQVTVNYVTASDTATSGTDFQAAGGTLTFAPGQTSKTIDIAVSGDTLYEADETLFVTLSGASNTAFVADGQAVGTISNDDAAPTLSINDVSQAEGNAGKLATFTVTLSAASSFPVSFTYATLDGTAIEGGTANSGQDDYEATSDVLVIPAGKTSATISVLVNGDTIPESSETFFVQLSAPQDATISDAQGQATITNDDALPTISITDVSDFEGNAGTKPFTFTVTLSGPSGGQVTVDYATANGTASSLSDYDAASGTVTFAPGEVTATITVSVVGDTAVEGKKDETFYVNLTNPFGATINDAQGIGTIQSDD